MDSDRKNLARRARHRVVVLVRHGVLPMELGLVHQLFGNAAGPDGARLYEVVTCTPLPGSVRTDADFTVQVPYGPEMLARADTVVVPASHESDERPHLDPDLADALARIRPGARIASICTGAFVLAAAGLLDGRRATTHWKSAERFRRLFPAVHLDPDVLYVDEGRVLTSAGEASGIDLCLHLIRRDHGASVANAVARTTVVAPHRDGGQAQFMRQPLTADENASTAGARSWAMKRLGDQLTLAQLASRSAMSVRSFNRRFQAEVGTTPMRWLARQRLQRARALLEETTLPIDQVASESGFGTGTSMRQHFQASLSTTPTAYRKLFRGREGG
ncbi:helix-turn-helix domain-containing protein [Actinopolymorpha sp. NPDC004070]|uniref:GlxA family transcriptional regulator n=1 Tax=Actinopolymorpha sp. NPDC004070 TaxID=3154548 RepID=UPI0033AD6B6D